MKLVTAVRLFPDAAADAALRDTLALCNQAANLVSAVAFGQGIRSRQALQRKTYRDLKDMGLSAQPFDDRCLSWQLDRRTVSIWTTTCEVPETPAAEPGGFLGVDLGIANIATTSDGTRYSGKFLNRVRHRHARLRAKLQSKGTKSAKRLLKKRARKEAGSRPTPITASPSRS